MNKSRKLLIAGGLALAIWGMGYGLYYALFDEHQTLERIGASLTQGFAYAAERNMPAAHAALDAYAETKFEYVREVDVHSHWTGLALLLIVFGVVFDRVAFEERTRLVLAAMLAGGSVIFPLGVILQTLNQSLLPKMIAVVGAGLLILSLGAVALGFYRNHARARPPGNS
ncbi:MAG: hypothetical protein ACE5IP_00235 [Terriglobia bacterium]